MKKFIRKITSKKALVLVLVITLIATVFDLVQSFRTGSSISYGLLGSVFASIAVWANELENKSKKVEQ